MAVQLIVFYPIFCFSVYISPLISRITFLFLL